MDTIEALIRSATAHLDDLGYAEGTKIRYKGCWNHFKKYGNLKNVQDFSLEFGYKFLADHYRVDFDLTLTHFQRFTVRCIKVLNEFSEGKPYIQCYQRKGLQVPDCFFDLLMNYIENLQNSGLASRTIQGKRITLTQFLCFLETNGINEISKVQPQIVLRYIELLVDYATSTVATILFTLRDFFNFISVNNYNGYHLTRLFPVIRSNKLERLPSYYTVEEIRDVLASVDRSTTIGRRDYLVLVLAIQLGLRAGDIRKLKLDDIKWHIDKIEFIQEKTKNPLQLPLSDNVKYALIDYLKNSRPLSDDPHIFLRQRAPYSCFVKGNVFWSIINKYLNLAKIEMKDRKHGLHAMRHSLASNLLIGNTPLPIITGILGHENSNTTKMYLRIDIEQLRTIGLEVPL